MIHQSMIICICNKLLKAAGYPAAFLHTCERVCQNDIPFCFCIAEITFLIMKGVIIMFVRTCDLTKEDRKKVSEMTGKTMLWILEGRSIWYIAEQLKLKPREVEENIDETLYIFRQKVGRWRFFKILFRK